MYVFGVILVLIFPAFSRVRTEYGEVSKILNPICHVVVPSSIDFEDLAVVFSAHVYRENKEHVYLSGKIRSNRLEKA